MARKIGLKDAFKIDKPLWAKIGSYATAQIKKRTQAGKDREGKQFPAYSPKYAELKSEGFQRKTTRTGNKGTKRAGLFGGSTSRQIYPPDFRLRGRTMGDLKARRVTDRTAEIGWRNEYATIVAAHEERGKYKVAGLSDDDLKELMNVIDGHMVQQWNRKTKSVVTEIKI